MMFGIITAMKEEADFIIDLYNLQLFSVWKNIKIYKNENIVLVLTGIGKIQASMGTTILLEKFNLRKIINIGIAGNTGKQKNSSVGDVFFVNKVYQHDIYLPFDGEHLDYFKKGIELKEDEKMLEIVENEKFDFKVYKNSICATGDQFIDDKKKVKEIKEKFDADVVEMEAFAVASVCREYDLLDNLIIIKSISDGADEKAHTEHEDNLDRAMKNSIKVLKSIIKE